MLSAFRNRFGVPGIISVIALVFAMFGGAYAASDNGGSGKATASAKAKKGPRGPRGPVGPAGPQGPAGPKGDTGAAGSNGTNGKDGVSVTSEAFPTTLEGKCAGEGGTKFTSVSGSTFACNGKDGEDGEPGEPGEPWTAGGTLPQGATETGGWAFSGTYTSAAPPKASISFPIQLAAPLGPSQVHLINKDGKELVLDLEAEEVKEVTPTKCGGTAKVPTAAEGHLCVYSGLQLLKEQGIFSSTFITNPGDPCAGISCDPIFGGQGAGASVAGAVVTFEYQTANVRSGHGTWAVTAPTA